MEEVLSRFPHIGEGIFKELDGKGFCKSMEVKRSWNYFIRNQRVLQGAYKAHKLQGKKIIQEKIQSLSEEIRNRELIYTTPIHLAARRGFLAVCQEIMENADDKNPKDRDGWTPLHKAAENGHLSVCLLIVENVDDKNPKDNSGRTPLQWAVRFNHLGIKKLIEDAQNEQG